MNEATPRTSGSVDPDISCQDVLDFICAQFGEDDDSERCRAVRTHLSRCPDCSSYCDSLEKMIGLYRAAAPSFPDTARTHLLEQLGIPPAASRPI
jgi:hypothetical protein